MLLRVLCCAIALGTAACTFDPSGTGDARSSRSRRDSANARSDSDEEAARIAADRRGTSRKDAGADGAIGVGEEEAAGSAGEDARGTRGPSTAAAARTGENGAETAAAGSVAAAGGGGASGTSSSSEAERGRTNLSPDDADAGEDDSDAGTDPKGPNPDPSVSGGAAGEPGGAGSGGEGGTAAEAGAGGRASAGTSGTSGNGSSGDRELLLSLLDVVVGVLQEDLDADAGDLLSVLANATSVDPDLLERVLVFVNGSQECDRRDSDPCDRVCEVVASRCEECSDDEDCRAALRTACGSDATQCR